MNDPAPPFPAPYDDVPVSDIDPYDRQNLLDARVLHAELRAKGPLVWLQRYGIWATGSHLELSTIFKDHKRFCSSRGVGIQDFKTDKPWRPPSLILEVDPPAHTRTRKILSSVLSRDVLEALRESFVTQAEQLVSNLLEQGEIDGVADLAVTFPLKVFPPAVGLTAPEGQPLLDYGTMVFNMLGPNNEIAEQAQQNAATVLPWIAAQCARENLLADGLGRSIYAYADRDEITEEEASLLVRSLLSAGLDTTVIALGNALHCFAEHPEQWKLLRAEPQRARFAFEEVLRFASPVHTFYRTADADTEVSGIRISEGHKIMLNIECANRDTQRWADANSFDIMRRPGGHAAFGVGIHACVGRHLAALEAEVLLQALAAKVERIELAGEPVREPNNSLTGYRSLPLLLS